MTLSYQEWLLALVMWREARGEAETGMRAVGHVIRNRVFAKWGSWFQVITNPLQFTSINPPKTPEGWPKDGQCARWPAPEDQVWMHAQEWAHLIFSGQDHDVTGGALYYANLTHIDKGGWFEKEILGNPQKYPQTATLGSHTFFREVPA